MDSIFLYIDPGMGSAAVAMILGVIAGVSMYIKSKWQSLKYKLSKN